MGTKERLMFYGTGTKDATIGGKRKTYRQFIEVSVKNRKTDEEVHGLFSWHAYHALERDLKKSKPEWDLVEIGGFKMEYVWEDIFKKLDSYGKFERPKVILKWPV